jgi:hypothetical protein
VTKKEKTKRGGELQQIWRSLWCLFQQHHATLLVVNVKRPIDCGSRRCCRQHTPHKKCQERQTVRQHGQSRWPRAMRFARLISVGCFPVSCGSLARTVGCSLRQLARDRAVRVSCASYVARSLNSSEPSAATTLENKLAGDTIFTCGQRASEPAPSWLRSTLTNPISACRIQPQTAFEPTNQ